ncbi:MAG: dihydropyrimidinase [Rubrobacteraceae bacterium]|nr:dihydropyrimidinase [Rubrobacteraceae bacterium]
MGGTVVTADGSFRADVLVEDEKIVAVGTDLPDDFTKIPNGLPGAEERAMTLWTLGVREGQLTENQFVAVLSTNQARIYGAYPRKGALVPGADADIVLWDPELCGATSCTGTARLWAREAPGGSSSGASRLRTWR